MDDDHPKLFVRNGIRGAHFQQVKVSLDDVYSENVEKRIEEILNKGEWDIADGDFVLVQWPNGNILPLTVTRSAYQVARK